jgi:Tol biopolymer transport system component
LRTPNDLPLNEVGPLVSIAPDGSFLVFVGPDPEVVGVTALWRRPLDRLDATSIPGTRGAQRPRVMPGGRTVQFYKRHPSGTVNVRFEIPIEGGVPTSAPVEREMLRTRDGRAFVFSDDSGGFEVVSPGDQQRRIVQPGAAETIARSVALSPNARWMARVRRIGQTDSISLRKLQPGPVSLIAAGVSPTFLDNDILAFRAADGSLQVGRLKPDGTGFAAPPITMVPNVSLAGDASAVYAVGDDGTLVYSAGGASALSRLTWVTPSGSERPVPNIDSRVFGGLALAPDGKRAALSVGALASGGDIWVAELESGSLNPLTSNGVSGRPFWLRDGRTVTYVLTALGAPVQQLERQGAVASRRAIDTSAPADSLRGPWPATIIDELVWSPDERYMAMRARSAGGTRDIFVRRADSDSIVPFAAEPRVQERGPRFSPEGKWLLYVSNRSGRDEVYAESFPQGGNRVQLSLDGGREGTWSRDGSRVFYRSLDGWMTAGRLTLGATLTVAGRDRLFDATPYLANQFLAMYDVAPDGRFLMFKLDPQPARTDVVIIRNWVQQVKGRLRN